VEGERKFRNSPHDQGTLAKDATGHKKKKGSSAGVDPERLLPETTENAGTIEEKDPERRRPEAIKKHTILK